MSNALRNKAFANDDELNQWLVNFFASKPVDCNERARTVVRTKQGYSTEFEVKVGGPPRISTQSTTFCSCDGSSDSRSKKRITMGTVVCR